MPSTSHALTHLIPQKPDEAGPLIIPVLQTRNLKLRDGKQLAEGHTARKLGSQDANPGLLAFEAHALSSTPRCFTQLWVRKDWTGRMSGNKVSAQTNSVRSFSEARTRKGDLVPLYVLSTWSECCPVIFLSTRSIKTVINSTCREPQPLQRTVITLKFHNNPTW